MTETRIAFGALALRPGGSGVQTYIRGLLGELPALTPARLSAVVQSDATGELPPAVRPRVRGRSDGARRALAGLLPVQDVDLFHGLDVDLPAAVRGAAVATVHDTAVFDTPWAFRRVRTHGEQLLMRRSVRRADAVVAVSAFTAERVRALFGVDSHVTPLAPAAQFVPPDEEACVAVRARYGLPATFVLHVGTVEPRKDVPLLASVARALQVPLVLAGAVAAGQVVPPGAQHLGYVPAGDLPALYATATVVAYPSRYEGFGLPPLEALACGGVVLASRVGALPETLGAAARLVPARDEEQLTAALRSLLADADERAALRAAGVARSRQFTWNGTAAGTLGVYRRLGIRC